MSRSPKKSFDCPVVSETVTITLARRHRFSGPGELYVKCSESECQYVDTNAPPCPLHLGMFAEELESRAARRQDRIDSEW
jgi:hypothetical protein